MFLGAQQYSEACPQCLQVKERDKICSKQSFANVQTTAISTGDMAWSVLAYSIMTRQAVHGKAIDFCTCPSYAVCFSCVCIIRIQHHAMGAMIHP